MPELPEVEILKRYVDATALHQRIEAVSVKNRRILPHISPQTLARELKGHEMQTCWRHGKWLFAELDDRGGSLVFHFGMTGSLQYCKEREGKPLHTRFLLQFAHGPCLAFICPRMFGTVDFTEDASQFIATHTLGPDALGLTWDCFKARLADKQGAIKSTLMDQSCMAGIGNIYADEILFHARLHPHTKIERLNDRALRKLYTTLEKVLRKAIDCHADPARMPRSWLLPLREKAADCPRCGSKLQQLKVQQRSAYVCPQCQRPAA
jgi:formamidopyrimidine-DNA glycosylase